MHVCIVAYKFYESSPRLMMFANALSQRGDSVEVICLRRPSQVPTETIRDVVVNRIQERTRNERNPLTYLLRILTFLAHALMRVTVQHMRRPYDLVHAFAIPDFLVFAGLFPRVLGTPVLLDCFDLVPELYASKFGARECSIVFRLLVWVERMSIQFSQHVFVPNAIWRNRLISRSVQKEKCSVVQYFPDPTIFYPRPRTRTDGKFLLIYPGSLNSHQGVDVAIRAFARVAPRIPCAEFHIYGEGPAEPYLRKLIEQLGLGHKVIIHPFLPAEQIAAIIAECDLGIVAKRANSRFGNEAPSTKILEFLAVGLSVVASRSDAETIYLSDAPVCFVSSENEELFAASILSFYQDKVRGNGVAASGPRFLAGKWQAERDRYLQVVNSLCSPRRGGLKYRQDSAVTSRVEDNRGSVQV